MSQLCQGLTDALNSSPCLVGCPANEPVQLPEPLLVLPGLSRQESVWLAGFELAAYHGSAGILWLLARPGRSEGVDGGCSVSILAVRGHPNHTAVKLPRPACLPERILPLQLI